VTPLTFLVTTLTVFLMMKRDGTVNFTFTWLAWFFRSVVIHTLLSHPRAEQLGRQNLICMAACSKITKNSFFEMQELLHAQECAIYARIGCFGLLPHPFKIVGAVHRRRLAGWHCRRIFFHTIFVVPIDQLTVAHSCSNFLAHHTQIMRHIH